MKYRVRVELTESGFADRTATATYGTYQAAETGIEPISSESESDVIPLHYSAIYKGDGTRTHIPGVKVLCTYHLYDTLSFSRKDGT